MLKNNKQKNLNSNRVVERDSRGKSKSSKKKDSTNIKQLQEVFEKLIIEDEETAANKEDFLKSLAIDGNLKAKKDNYKEQKGADEKMTIDATKRKKTMGNIDSSATSEFYDNQTQRMPLKNQPKDKYVPAGSNQKVMVKCSDDSKNSEKISNDTTGTGANEPTTSDKNHPTSRIPMKVKRRDKSGNKNLSKQQSSSVNKENFDINTEMSPKGQNIVEKRAQKMENINKPRKINKTFIISSVKSKKNVKIIESKDKIDCTDGKEMAKMNVPSKTDSPVIAHIKRENQSSPQSPIAAVSKYSSCPTPPMATIPNQSVDIKKYEKSFSVEERNLLIYGKGIKQEKNVENMFENIKDTGKTSGNQLSTENLKKETGCSSMKVPYTLSKKTKGESQTEDTGKDGGKNSREECTCNNYEERRKRKKEKKLADAFEKLGKRFVSVAKKMGYLNDSAENSSTDDSEDYSEHSTDCSCSSCTSYSESSDGFSEFTVSGSSSSDSKSDSSSTD